MLKKTIKYTDYNDEQQERTFFFNLSKAEVSKLELSTPGGLKMKIEKMINDKDGAEIITIFNELIMMSYGEKSTDGRFIKSQELSKAFSETVAYDQLFMELITDAEKASAFIAGILPKEIEMPKPN